MASSFPTSLSSRVAYVPWLDAAQEQKVQEWQQRQQLAKQINTPLFDNFLNANPQETSAQLPGTFVQAVGQQVSLKERMAQQTFMKRSNDAGEGQQPQRKRKKGREDDGRLENLSQHQPYRSEISGDQSGKEGQQKISLSASDPKQFPSHFPTQLHQMLKQPDFSKFLCWNADGRSWRIVDRLLLSQKLWPAKYADFMGEIDAWGFSRCIDGYFHKQFIRENPDLCFFMKRKTIGQYEQAHSEEQAQLKEFEHPSFALSTDAPQKPELLQQQKVSSIEAISDDSKGRPTKLHNIDLVPTRRKPVATLQKPDKFPESYKPGALDVLLGRGTRSSGNGAFHNNIQTHHERSSKTSMAMLHRSKLLPQEEHKQQLQQGGAAMSLLGNEANDEASHYKLLQQEGQEHEQLQHGKTTMSVPENEANDEESQLKLLQQEGQEQEQQQHDGTAISVSKNEADNEESHYKVLARLNPQLCFAVKSVLQTCQKVHTEGNKVRVHRDTTIDEAVARIIEFEEWISKKRKLLQQLQKQQYDGTAIALRKNKAEADESPSGVNPYLHLAMESINKTDLQLPNKSSSQKRDRPVMSEGSPVCFAAVWSSCNNKPPA